MTFGVTFSLLIGLYVKKELSIDKAFVNGEMIYRLEFEYPDRGKNAVMVSALGPDLKSNIAGIEDVLRIQIWDDIILKKDDANYFNIPRVCLADSSFFNFFEQTWIYGSPEDALTRPLSIVLTDERLGKILFYFTFLAIMICILGLIGLAVFMTEQRIREIAILKTYGATVSSVIAKLTKEFLLIVVIANVIGCPVVLWAGNKWLDEFVYKTGIGAGIFITGALLSVTIAMVTVISVTYRAATSNPADSLRSE